MSNPNKDPKGPKPKEEPVIIPQPGTEPPFEPIPVEPIPLEPDAPGETEEPINPEEPVQE